jgi:hypothetical protein
MVVVGGNTDSRERPTRCGVTVIINATLTMSSMRVNCLDLADSLSFSLSFCNPDFCFSDFPYALTIRIFRTHKLEIGTTELMAKSHHLIIVTAYSEPYAC